jgi:hypothetical protein
MMSYTYLNSCNLTGPLNKAPLIVVKAFGNNLHTKDGRKILDACCGVGVSCIGHGNTEVINGISNQAKLATYATTSHFYNEVSSKLTRMFIKSTNYKMSRVYLAGSGSEGTKAALKPLKHGSLPR